MENTDKKLELILIYLLGKADAPDELRRNLSQLLTQPEMGTLLERMENLLSQQDDPEWIEAVAAASEGVMTPEVLDFLRDREVLAQLEPEVLNHFDALFAPPPPDDLATFPAFPTWVEQFQDQEKIRPSIKPEQTGDVKQDAPTPSIRGVDPNWQVFALEHGRAWLDKLSGRWRRLQIVLPALTDITGGNQALAGMMGETPTSSPDWKQLEVATPDHQIEVRLTAVIEPAATGEAVCRVEVKVGTADLFADVSGLLVILWGEESSYQAKTDKNGVATLAGIPGPQLASMELVVDWPN